MDIGVPDGVPGGQVYHSGDGQAVLPLEHHDGLQGALAEDAVHRQPGEDVVVDGQLVEHVLEGSDGLAAALRGGIGGCVGIHGSFPSFQAYSRP